MAIGWKNPPMTEDERRSLLNLHLERIADLCHPYRGGAFLDGDWPDLREGILDHVKRIDTLARKVAE